jgi:hypothetical protein
VTPDRPLLEGWLHLTDAERRELFSDPDHRAAVGDFATHADQHMNADGSFVFPMFADMALVVSSAAVQKALKHSKQTAEALAHLVTLPVGSRKRQFAATILIQLIGYLSPRVSD